MLNQVPLVLSFLPGGVAASDYAGVLHVKASYPRSWDVVTTHVLGTFKLLVLHSWMPGPHQVVEEHACCDNELDGLGLLLHRAQLRRTWNILARMPKAFSTTLLARESR